MNARGDAEEFSLVLQPLSAAAPERYSVERAAHLAGVHPELVRYYCRLGLFGPALAAIAREPILDDTALQALRRFEYFRRHHGVDRRTLRLLFGLWRDVDRLEAELRFHRG